ncbi:MAG TPA: T9SS type A sorting domain-containing protein [Chryseosolibacter sp.]|nr:T9SS type A sorting domain-containing protein [Chryseosolibacter sp.]
MKKILLLSICTLFVTAAYCDVTFPLFKINDVSPGNTIYLPANQTIELEINYTAKKSSNQVVGNSVVYLQILDIFGQQDQRILVNQISDASWWNNEVSFTDLKVDFTMIGLEFNARLLFVSSSGVEYGSSTIKFLQAYPPVADAGPNATIFCPESVEIGGYPSAYDGLEPYVYSWEPSNGLSATNVANPVASPTSTTLYTLTVTDARGFKATDHVLVSVVLETTPAIGGSTYMYKPCPYTVSKKSFYLSTAIPNHATNLTWTTSYGTITKYYYTNGLKTGVEITIGQAPLPEVRKYSSVGSNEDFMTTGITDFVIECTATYPCGTKKGSKTVELRNPVCKVIPPSPYLLKSDLLEVKEFDRSLPREEKLEINVFPNPVSSELNLSMLIVENSSCNIKLVNQQTSEEMMLDSRYVEKGKTNLIYNVSGLRRGVYVLTIELNGIINRKKIVLY